MQRAASSGLSRSSYHCQWATVTARSKQGLSPALGKQWSRDYPIDVPATPTLPDSHLRYHEALDWSKWTKGECTFLPWSAQFDRAIMGPDTVWLLLSQSHGAGHAVWLLLLCLGDYPTGSGSGWSYEPGSRESSDARLLAGPLARGQTADGVRRSESGMTRELLVTAPGPGPGGQRTFA